MRPICNRCEVQTHCCNRTLVLGVAGEGLGRKDAMRGAGWHAGPLSNGQHLITAETAIAQEPGRTGRSPNTPAQPSHASGRSVQSAMSSGENPEPSIPVRCSPLILKSFISIQQSCCQLLTTLHAGWTLAIFYLWEWLSAGRGGPHRTGKGSRC